MECKMADIEKANNLLYWGPEINAYNGLENIILNEDLLTFNS
jgi:hypothetical protein